MRRPILSPRAEADLDEIWLYIARDSVSAASRFIAQLQEKCQMLAESPALGPRREELAPSLRSFAVGEYVIFYRATNSGINVARVLHGRRNIEAEFNR